MRHRFTIVLCAAFLGGTQVLFGEFHERLSTDDEAADAAAVAPAAAPMATKFYLACDASDLAGQTNNSAVVPPINASGIDGTLIVNGLGSLNFSPVQVGNGVSFEPGDQQQTHAAFYRFTGETVGKLFDIGAGEVSFYLKSTHTFAERLTLTPRFVFEVYGDGLELFQFSSYIFDSRRLKFRYKVAGLWGEYDVPTGHEDTLFGEGVVMKVRLIWNSSIVQLFLNDTLVHSAAPVPLPVNWANQALFVFGGSASYGGGFFASDDVIDEFRILGPSPGPVAPPLPPQNVRIVRGL
jgi:hypothetical protein